MLMAVMPDTALNMEPIKHKISCCSDLSVCSGGTLVCDLLIWPTSSVGQACVL